MASGTEWIVLRGAPGVEVPEEGAWLWREWVDGDVLKVSTLEVAIPIERYERHPDGGPIAQVWEVHRVTEAEVRGKSVIEILAGGPSG